MNALYDFPKAAAFGRVVSKSKIYDHATPGNKVKNLFVSQVEKIIWSYKLSPETINLPASTGIEEIQIFTIITRTGEISEEILRTIDKAIPSPILFELQYSGKTRYAASYKRPSEADKNKWVISSYFFSDWIAEDSPKSELPVVLNMGTLYQSLLAELSPIAIRKRESLDELAARVDLLRVKEREASLLSNRIDKEKQFNRRVELNRRLNTLKVEIEGLRK